MKFNEKLVLVMQCLNVNNIELSRVCQFDPTVISRYRCGKRIPTQNSNALNNLVNGICSIAIASHKESKIRQMCRNEEKDLFTSIMSWFCEDKSSIRLSKSENGLIGENLTIVMKTLNITNVELAKYISKDYSLISKYKNNVTILLQTDSTAEKMCEFFINFAFKNSSVNLLTSLLGIEQNSDKEKIRTCLMEFLFYNKRVTSPIDNFLVNLSSFKINSDLNIPSINDLVPNKILNDEKEIYIGTNEFRDAVKRFLGSVVTNKAPTVLSLYSDESMRWMTESKAFFNVWKALMISVLMKKNKIKIIHNINRNLVEMFDAIEVWLPLYMTGLIEPYYCKKALNNRFNHTLFLAKDLSVISSCSVRGNESNTIYNYSRNKKVIKKYEEQYATLLEHCAPLVKIYVGNDINKKLKNTKGYRKSKNDNLKNIEILLKKDVSTLVLKNDTPCIMFEFEHPAMVETFENFLDYYGK